jgi:hypothetical protein
MGRTLRLDTDRNGAYSELTETQLSELVNPKLRPRIWGPFEIDMSDESETTVLELSAGQQLVLTAVVVFQDIDASVVSEYGTIEVLNESDSITGPILVEADSGETYRHVISGRAGKADGDIKISVISAQEDSGSSDAQIYLEGFLI